MHTKKLLKRIGYILLSLLPFAAAMAIQFAAVFICTFCMGIYMHFTAPSGSALDAFSDTILSSSFNTAAMVLYSVITIILLGTWYHVAATPRRMPRRTLREIFHPRMLAALILLVAAMQYLSGYIVSFIAYARPGSYEYYANLVESAGLNDVTVLLAFYTVIAAPICEELIFRGVMLHYAKKGLPFWLANILQAVVFGFFHMNLVQGTYAFLLGLLLGYVFWKGKSIYLSILFHILFNIWGTFLVLPTYTGSSGFIHLLILAVSLLAVAGGLTLYKNGASANH